MSLDAVLTRIDSIDALLHPQVQAPSTRSTASTSFEQTLAGAMSPSSGANGSTFAQGTPSATGLAQYGGIIRDAAARYGVDPALVTAIVDHESRFQPNATSYAGAMGLMQLMPATAAGLGVTNAYDPAQNVDGGTRLLRQMLDRYHGNLQLALAAYAAGSGAVDAAGGIPPSTEAQNFVRDITGRLAAEGVTTYDVQTNQEGSNG